MITFKHIEDGRHGKFILLENEIPAGEMTYVWAGEDKFIIDHTETYDGFGGRGLAKQLVLGGIAYAKEQDVKIIPLCPYAKKVMEADPELSKMIYH